MNDSVFSAGQRFKGFGNDVFARLGEYLNGDIVRNQIPFDKGAAEFVFSLAGGREADLNFLKADADEIAEKFELFFKAHRNDERLVAVAKIHAAPDRRFVDAVFFHPFGIFDVCRKILFLVEREEKKGIKKSLSHNKKLLCKRDEVLFFAVPLFLTPCNESMPRVPLCPCPTTRFSVTGEPVAA